MGHIFAPSMIKKVLPFLVFMTQFVYGQKKEHPSFLLASDTLNTQRLKSVCIGQGALWVGSMVALNQAWYAHYPRSSFHFFNDNHEWNQIDKVGHSWSAYWGTQFSSSLFRWSGMPRRKAAIYGAGMGIAYEGVIEILDGFSTKWGFSLGDMAANTSGSLLYATQEYAWGEQRIEFKFSTHRYQYPSNDLKARADNLFGSSSMERILKDYNAQTYWLSANIWSFAKSSKFPKWLNIAVGYGADGLYGGFDNIQRDDQHQVEMHANGQPVFDRRDIVRTRQFYLAPDIDVSKIEIRGRRLKLLKALNGLKLKFPMPALELNNQGRFTFHRLYF